MVEEWKPGDRIDHWKYGFGTVQSVRSDRAVEVAWDKDCFDDHRWFRPEYLKRLTDEAAARYSKVTGAVLQGPLDFPPRTDRPHRRRLKGLAHDLTFQFNTSIYHIAYRAVEGNISEVALDLTMERFEPEGFNDGPRNVGVRDRLMRTMAHYREEPRLPSPSNARVVARFALDTLRQEGKRERLDVVYEATVWDDRGKAWMYTLGPKRPFLDPTRF